MSVIIEQAEIIKIKVPRGSVRPKVEGYYMITLQEQKDKDLGLVDCYEYIPMSFDLCSLNTVRTTNYVVRISEK